MNLVVFLSQTFLIHLDEEHVGLIYLGVWLCLEDDTVSHALLAVLGEEWPRVSVFSCDEHSCGAEGGSATYDGASHGR